MLFFPIDNNTLIASSPQEEVLSLSGDYLAPDPSNEQDIVYTPKNTSTGQISGKNDHINPTKAELVAYLTEIFGERLMPHFFALSYCESRLRQFDNGKPLISPTKDVGILQISIPTWGEKAKELGLDIYNSWRENVKMARYVFDHQTARAWTCTQHI